MASSKRVWGIDIGQSAVKALELRAVKADVEVCAVEIIEYAAAPPGAQEERRELVRDAIRRFLDHRDLTGCHVAVSVPGRDSCSRFVHLAPIDGRDLPRLIRYEAGQQIPFPMEEVIWRWQTFRDPESLDSPDVDAGIFAARRRDVGEMLLLFSEANVNVDTMQTAPLALYNFLKFTEALPGDAAALLVDLGADEMDLVVADRRRIWTRTEPLGARRLTEALAREFELPFEEAEALKRSAPEGENAERIARAMGPVFREIADGIRRCMDDYTKQHPGSGFARLIAAGGGFALPALQAFVEQDLDIRLVRIDVPGKLAPSASVAAPELGGDVASLAVAYGLALQGLGLTPVHVNFLPAGVAHKWAGAKSPRSLGRAARSLLGRLRPRRRPRG